MLNWLTNFCGSPWPEFNRAVMACTQSDWTVPCKQDIKTILATFRGLNPQTTTDMAFNQFVFNFQNNGERENPAFKLKNLLLLDIAVSQKVLLDKIALYENTNLISRQTQDNDTSSLLKGLISRYYIYIKAKAKSYKTKPTQLFNRSSRQQYIESLKISEIIKEVENCFIIQNLIVEMSQWYSHGNRNGQTIKFIFTQALKSYLLEYSVVCIGIKLFFSTFADYIEKCREMDKDQINYLCELVKYVNKEYTKNFLVFVEKNKAIQSFKYIKYNEFIKIDEGIVWALTASVIKQKKEDDEIPIKQFPIPTETTLEIQIQPEQKQESSKRRLQCKLKKAVSYLNEDPFEQYQNLYHDQFVAQFSDEEKEGQKPKRSFRLKNKFTLYQGQEQIGLTAEAYKKTHFDEQKWGKWDNVFAY